MRPRRRPPSTMRSDVLEEATSASTGWARMVTLSTWTSGYFSPHPATVSAVRASSSWANRAFESSADSWEMTPATYSTWKACSTVRSRSWADAKAKA